MLFSDASKRRFSMSKLADVVFEPNNLKDIERELGLDIEVVDTVRDLAVVQRSVLDAENGIETAIHKALGSAVGAFCLPHNVDMARKSLGRTWLSQIVKKFEASGWLAVDALVDVDGRTVLASFAPVAHVHESSSRFWFRDRFISLIFASATDIMRSKSVLSGSFYEKYMLDHIASTYSRGDIIDVGANVGNHTVYFALIAGKAGYRVHAVEPAPAALNLLCRNIETNQLDELVTVNRTAAGARAGRIALQAGSESNSLGAMRVVGMAGEATGIEAEISRLDDIIPADRPISVIKVDVEGYEVPALTGGCDLLKKWRPDLYLEAGKAAELECIEKLLLPMGYKRRAVFNDTPTYWFAHELGREVG